MKTLFRYVIAYRYGTWVFGSADQEWIRFKPKNDKKITNGYFQCTYTNYVYKYLSRNATPHPMTISIDWRWQRNDGVLIILCNDTGKYNTRVITHTLRQKNNNRNNAYENKVAALVNYNNPAGELKSEIGFVVLSHYIVFLSSRLPHAYDIIN